MTNKNVIKLSAEDNGKIISFFQNNINTLSSLSSTYRELMLTIYREASVYTSPDIGQVETRLKVNKIDEFVKKSLPRIMAKSPKWLVSARTEAFFDSDEELISEWNPLVVDRIRERNIKMSAAVQDYLTIVFNQQSFKKRLKVWAKQMLTYWNAFAQVVWDYKVQRSKVNTKSGQKVTEKVVDVMPNIELCSWSEMYYDPRYLFMEDMPWVFRIRRSVSLQSLWASGKYYNLDEIEKLAWTTFTSPDSYSNAIYWVTWVSDVKIQDWIDKNNLDLQIYYGKYSLTWKANDERLYEITVINNAVVIWIQEITEIPIVDIKAHEDQEVFFATWLWAAVLPYQDELNFQKNAMQAAIAKWLNRSYYWSPMSWVDPSQLVWDKPWNIIVCQNWVDQAQRNLQEQQNAPLPPQYFANINDLNRDAQNSASVTDVTQPQGQTALTNTATGARISFFESNAVMAEIRKNFEKGMETLAYKILDWTVNNMDRDIIIKSTKSGEFLKMNKDVLQDALKRYDIRIETNSSAFDDIENRRADAIALKNLSIEAANAWVNVDLQKVFKKIYSTFEAFDPDDIIKDRPENEAIAWSQGNIPRWQKAETNRPPTTPAELTSAVAGWQIFENL